MHKQKLEPENYVLTIFAWNTHLELFLQLYVS